LIVHLSIQTTSAYRTKMHKLGLVERDQASTKKGRENYKRIFRKAKVKKSRKGEKREKS
jgi:predicted transcriptional regulator